MSHSRREGCLNVKGKNQYRWIIDPVVGTTNLLIVLPLYGICIGLENMEKVVWKWYCKFPSDE